MADDATFYDLAVRFPEAVLALLGVTPAAPYRGEAVEVKVTRRSDAVLFPEAPPAPPTPPVDPSAAPGSGVAPAPPATPVVLSAAAPGAPRFYVEHQARSDPDVERSLLLKVVAHCVQQRSRGPARAVIFYTERRFLEAAEPAEITTGLAPLVRFEVERVVLAELDPARLLAAGVPGLLALPLVGTRAQVLRDAGRWRAALDRALAGAPERAVPAEDLFVRLLATRLPDEDVYALLKGEEAVVEDTLTGRNLIARGVARGKAEGKAEGRAEGKAEGRAEGLRAAVLDALDARGLVVPADVRQRLERETDPARLVAIHRAALRVGPDLAGLFPAG